MANNVLDGTRIPAGYEQTADLSTAQTLNVPAGARVAIIQAVNNNVSWRDDGTAATVSSGGSGGGMILNAGSSFLYTGILEKLSFIEAIAASTAYVNITYYK